MRRILTTIVTCSALISALASCSTTAGGGAAGGGGAGDDTGTLDDAAAPDVVADVAVADVAVADDAAPDVASSDVAAPDAGCSGTNPCGTGAFCNSEGVCCPALGCDPMCVNGVKLDSNGCSTCQCAEPAGCTSNAECGASQYCAVAVGQCGSKGQCEAKPDVCAAIAPGPGGGVCGCDGKTYDTSCGAASEGVGVDYAGACSDTPKSCNPLSMAPAALCAPTEYCALAHGQCGSSQGLCTVKPEMCNQQYVPVCGCDGKTHGNACSAGSAGVNIASDGECVVAGEWTYFTTCGYPVCSSDWQPTDGVPLCTTEKQGAACANEGHKCDAKAGCGQFLLCTKSDPKQAGCPISKAKYKSDVRYVDNAERRRLADELLDTRLATYRYTATGPAGRRHLGFIIDDQPDGRAVDPQRTWSTSMGI